MKRFISLLLAVVMCSAVFSAGMFTSAETSNVSTGGASSQSQGTVISYTDGKTFTNPVANGADPFVFKDTDGTYYMYTTNAGGNGYIAYTSRDLVNWSSIDYVLAKSGVSIEGVETLTNFWAPEVFLYEGTYYMAVSVNEQLVIASGPSPRGPFTTAENTSYVFDYPSIDGNFFVDDDGTVYFYYVKTGTDIDFKQTHGNVIYGCEFDMETLTPIESTITRLVAPAHYTWEKEYGYVAEGPSVFKRDGKYYMLYTCNSFKSVYYAVGAATSSSPLGSFKKQTNGGLLSTTDYVLRGDTASGAVGTGHCCYTTSPDGTEMWMVYHKHAGLSQVENREICIDKMTFDSNGKVHVAADFTDGKPTMTPQPYPSGAECTVKPVTLDENFAALATLPTVYVHMNDGSDTATGTETDPYKTLERAYDALTPNGGTIVFIASHDISDAKSNDVSLSPEPQIAEKGNYFCTPTDITGPIMLRGRNPGIRLRFNYITFNSDHYIDNLMLRPYSVTPIIECGFNNVTFGENLSVSPAYEAGARGRYPFILGGYYQCGYGLGESDAYMSSSPYCYWKQDSRPYEVVSTIEDYTISVYGGTWRSIIGGNWRVRSDASVGLIDANVTLNLGGSCTVQPLVTNSSEMNYLVSVTGYTALSANGSATLNVTGGTYNCPLYVAGRIAGVAETEGVVHATERLDGTYCANILGGTVLQTVINGSARNAIISASQDGTYNIPGDYTLTIGEDAEFVGTAGFYTTYGSAKVTGATTAHITNKVFPIFTTSHFKTYDFYGNSGPVEIYIDQTAGSDKNSGLTPDTPVQNLGIAYKMLTPYGGTMNVMTNKLASSSSYYCTPVCGGPVTIRGTSPDVQWQIDYFSISSEHIFDNINIYGRGDTTAIECKFNDVTFTESVTTSCKTSGRYTFIVGGHYQASASSANFKPDKKTLEEVSTDKDYTITVNGGTWRSIRGGNWRNSNVAHIGSIDGNVTLNIGKNAVVTPVKSASENYLVTASGNNSSNGGTFTVNISDGATINSPVYGLSRLGSTTTSSQGEKIFKADVFINVNGTDLLSYAPGTSYEKKPTIAAIQPDSTTMSFDGTFVVNLANTTFAADSVVSGDGATIAHLYTDSTLASSTDTFDFIGASNKNGNVVADADGNGMLTNADITALVKLLSGYGELVVYDNDLDGNEKVNNRDAAMLIQLLAGWDVEIVRY